MQGLVIVVLEKKTTPQIYIHIIERLFGKGMNKLVSDFETLLFVSMSRFAQAAS